MKLKYFSERELACRHCGVIKLHPGWGKIMDDVREAWGRPMTVSSVCRCPVHNKAVGGAKNSYHLTEHPDRLGTMAADVIMQSGPDKAKFVQLVLDMGLCVGVNDEFIHIDGRALLLGKPQSLFTY